MSKPRDPLTVRQAPDLPPASLTELEAGVTPLPDGPFVWVLTLGADANYEATADSYQRLHDALPVDVKARSRVILLAPGYTLQSFDDDQLRNLGLQRIEVSR